MSSPYINQLLNGVCSAVYEDIELMLSVISDKYDIPIDDLRQLAYAASDEQKYKSVKPQKRQPKRAGLTKKPRKPSGYVEFSYQKRPEAKKLLASGEPSELTFKNKSGEPMTIDLGGKSPTFIHITQKIGSMWALLSTEEKQEYEEAAKIAPVRTKVQPKSKKGGKGTASATSDSSSASSASDNTSSATVDDADTADTEEQATPVKKGKETKPLPAKKAAAPAKPQAPAKKAAAPAKPQAPAKKGGKK